MTGRSGPAVLPSAVRVRLGAVAGLAVLVVAGLGGRYAGDGEPGRVDSRVWSALEDVPSPWRDVARAVDFLGEPRGAAALVVLAVAGCLLLRRPRAAVLVVTGAALAVGTTTLLKSLVGRTIHGDDNLAYP
ncbi:MAG: hypothetical protein H5T76_38215, partial [Streptomyces sp.]|nr:hypothetical protein [Streptomyces sp.]